MKLPRIACLLLPFALAACQDSAEPTAPIRPAQVWQVGSHAQANIVSYSGETKARFEADLAFRVAGKLTTRPAETGDHVNAGQVLASLDTADLDLNTQAAQATVRAALSEHTTAKAEWERNRRLLQKKFISQAALDAYHNRLQTAQANLNAAKAQLELAQNQAQYTDLKADKDGIITTLLAETGQVVAAGQPVAHIAYDGEREAHIRVGETTAKTLTEGTLVNVKLWSQPEQPFQGKVREIAPATDTTRSFLVKISLLDPPTDLRLGVTADISLPNNPQGDSQWLPATALFQQGQQPAVWVVDANQQVQTQAVTVIAYGENGITVSGLSVGTNVVAVGVHKLHAGQTITPVPYDGKAAP